MDNTKGMLSIFSFFPKQSQNTTANSFYAQNLPKKSKSAPKSVPTAVSKKSTAVEKGLKKLQLENVQLKTENARIGFFALDKINKAKRLHLIINGRTNK